MRNKKAVPATPVKAPAPAAIPFPRPARVFHDGRSGGISSVFLLGRSRGVLRWGTSVRPARQDVQHSHFGHACLAREQKKSVAEKKAAA